MMHCFVLFTDPGHVFEGIHRTVDGAAIAAASFGAASMPDGKPITVQAVSAALLEAPCVSFPCGPDGGVCVVHIERHGIFV